MLAEDAPTPFDEIYRWMGRVISIWSRYEAALFHVFYTALGADVKVASVTFYGYGSIRQRLEKTGKMVAIHTAGTELSTEWKSLAKATIESLELRNNVAHLPIVQLDEWAVGELGDYLQEIKYHLSEPDSQLLSLPKGKRPTVVTVRAMRKNVEDVVGLGEQLLVFQTKLLLHLTAVKNKTARHETPPLSRAIIEAITYEPDDDIDTEGDRA